MYRKFLWPCLLFVAITLMSVLPAVAGEPTNVIKRTADKIIAIVGDPKYKGPEKRGERNRLIRASVDEIFDREEMSRRTLATHWSKRTPGEKKEFMELFEDLLEQTYIDRVEGYSGEQVVYEGERIEGDYALVKVNIMTKQQTKIPVLYRLKKIKDRGWLVYDLSIQGVSLINNYRNQFNSIIANSSFGNLIKKLKEKVGSYPTG
ncbi:MAG: ABC transporter substrate-binding protein [Desulfatiglandaceae bacterium]